MSLHPAFEGWACFAKEMLGMTGCFITDPGDRFLVAKRRLGRTIRGEVDLGLQNETMSMKEAAALLIRTGMPTEQVQSSARKYILDPGFQLC